MRIPTLIFALALTGCAQLQGQVRGLMTDEYTSEAEFLTACGQEIEYQGVSSAAVCDELLPIYRQVRDAKLTFDEDALRDLIRERILDQLVQSAG